MYCAPTGRTPTPTPWCPGRVSARCRWPRPTPIIQFTAVLDATRQARSSLSVADIDLVEVNEAFAGEPLMLQRGFAVPDDKLNVNGGSIALGHPLGSTGARMLTALLRELERTGQHLGPQTICEANGTANTTIIQRI